MAFKLLIGLGLVKRLFSSSTKDEWMKSLNNEIESIRINQVGNLVDLPLGSKAIGNKQVL